MVGRNILDNKAASNYILLSPNSKELNLLSYSQVYEYINFHKPDLVIHAAGKVGGIQANIANPISFLIDNMDMGRNIILASKQNNVKKLINLGTSCMYPKNALNPLKEEYILKGELEPTNEGYAIAKITGVKACHAIRKQFKKDYLSLMPTNLYGYFDNFDLESSHVLPAMLRKFHEAKLKSHSDVILWGSGTPMREFLFVDDLVEAIIYALENNLPEYLYNVGTGKDITIKELAETIQKVTGHQGRIIWDSSKPDGTPRYGTATQAKILARGIKFAGWIAESKNYSNKSAILEGIALAA